MSYAVDTNILVRFLVRDDAAQAKLALELMETAQKRKQPLFVSSNVLLECIWVLDSVYNCSRDEILDAITNLMTLSSLDFEASPSIDEFIIAARRGTGELDDLLIGALARYQGCETVLTFDKSAAKTEYFRLVK